MSSIQSVDWVSIAVSALITCGITFAFAKLAKTFDARVAAENALVGLGPQIIANLNIRIAAMQEEISRLWERDRICQDNLTQMRDTINIKNTTISDLQHKVAILEQRVGSLSNDDRGL